MHPQSRPQARPAERGSAPRHTGYDEDDDEEDEDDDDADGGFADGEGDPCPNCGRVYRYLRLQASCQVPGHSVIAAEIAFTVLSRPHHSLLPAGLVISGYSATSVIPGMMASVYR